MSGGKTWATKERERLAKKYPGVDPDWAERLDSHEKFRANFNLKSFNDLVRGVIESQSKIKLEYKFGVVLGEAKSDINAMRAKKALALYNKGEINMIAVTGTKKEVAELYELLVLNKVPRDCVITIPGAVNTHDHARLVYDYFKGTRVNHFALISSNFHLKRAGPTFEHYAKRHGIESTFSPEPVYDDYLVGGGRLAVEQILTDLTNLFHGGFGERLGEFIDRHPKAARLVKTFIDKTFRNDKGATVDGQ
ncbi:MAG: YdcF family protein [Candidatus Micrarchaeota archaeon]|nr:YdcF family protein [Candidatus Micrarchaeota archaeon]